MFHQMNQFLRLDAAPPVDTGAAPIVTPEKSTQVEEVPLQPYTDKGPPVSMDDFENVGSRVSFPDTKQSSSSSSIEQLSSSSSSQQAVAKTSSSPSSAPLKDESELPIIDPTKPIERKVTQSGSSTSTGRDYEGLTDEEVKIFKNMSNEAYNKLRPIYKEHKQHADVVKNLNTQLEESKKGIVKIPDSYYENPDTWMITPTAQRLSQTLQNVEFESQHWAEQLNKIRKGEQWNQLMIDKQGKYYLSKPIEPKSEHEVDVIQSLTDAKRYVADTRKELETFSSTHISRSKNAIEAFKRFEDGVFPFYKDENNVHKDVIQKAFSKIPEELRHSPLASTLAKAYALIVALNNKVTELVNEKSTQDTIKVDQAKAGPTKEEMAGVTGTGKVNGSADVTIEDFEKAMTV